MSWCNIDKPWEVVLALDSAEGKHVNNSQCNEPIPQATIKGFEARYKKLFPRIKDRPKTCTAAYNCHGLVFASKRTKIFDAAEVRALLDQDSYKKLKNEADVLPGDICLYVRNGEIDHSAIVIELPQKGSVAFIPLVLSKWGNWAEVIHLANDCEWAREPDTKIEYYRIER